RRGHGLLREHRDSRSGRVRVDAIEHAAQVQMNARECIIISVMASHWRIAVWSSVVAAVAIATACTPRGSSRDPAAADVAAATKETQDWRVQHEDSYRKNWATIAGLHFLEPGS